MISVYCTCIIQCTVYSLQCTLNTHLRTVNLAFLDSSVSKYVGVWPEKMVDGEKVDITVRQLASHLGGIRSVVIKGDYEQDITVGQLVSHLGGIRSVVIKGDYEQDIILRQSSHLGE